ncbi:MAG: hypothetical protein WBM14_19170 [Terracidiphilus sp.]|jgi:hypothetical protein
MMRSNDFYFAAAYRSAHARKEAPTLSDLPERVPAELAGCSERKNMKINRVFLVLVGMALLILPALAQNKPSEKTVWKTYENSHGVKFTANMATVHHEYKVAQGVYVWGNLSGLDTSVYHTADRYQPMVLDCHGHFQFVLDNGNWHLARPGSIPDKVAKDVCSSEDRKRISEAGFWER